MASVTRILAATGIIAAALSLSTGSAQAQASRTWVSGVGDDANPCSRTAPCKTFAGAISKTAAKGEINCLDPGGFGAVTITKAITINCEGVIGGILASLTNGIIVNAAAADRVYLRGLDIDGFGNGLNGIRFLAGQALVVENCIIYGFTQRGIDAALTAAGSSLNVKDTTINNVAGAAIRMTSTAGGAALAVDHVNISRAGTNGVEAAAGAVGAINNSMMFGNAAGVVATAGGAILNVSNTMLANNNIGANASVAGASIGLDNNALYANNTAVNAVAGSQFVSAGNNKFDNNGSNGANPSSNMVIH